MERNPHHPRHRRRGSVPWRLPDGAPPRSLRLLAHPRARLAHGCHASATRIASTLSPSESLQGTYDFSCFFTTIVVLFCCVCCSCIAFGIRKGSQGNSCGFFVLYRFTAAKTYRSTK